MQSKALICLGLMEGLSQRNAQYQNCRGCALCTAQQHNRGATFTPSSFSGLWTLAFQLAPHAMQH